MKKSWVLAVLIPAIFILAWWAGYSLYGNDTGSTQGASNTSSTKVSVKTVTPPKVSRENRENETAQTPDVAETRDSERQVVENTIQNRLNYLGWEIDNDNQDGRVCFAFAEPLDEATNLKIRDYINIRPNFQFAQTISGNDLCISGFSFDRDYTVTLREGMPGIEKRKLATDIVETVSFGDKPQFVGFTGQGIILPRIGAQGLAIETVNVNVLEVEVSRVTDRMIARRDPQIGQSIMEGDYGWEGSNAANQIRSSIWEGAVDIKPTRNETVTTVLPLDELIGELEPGAYIVSVNRKHDDDENDYARAWRWIIVTDLAITSYRGDNGLNVGVRSIETAQLQTGTDILLVAENNDILAKAKTGHNGHVSFPAPILNGEGPLRPKMILAYGNDQDFAMLDLSRAPVDLSDHDVTGRRVDGAVDIYGFSERGVYRPGETVRFTVMTRNQQGNALSDRDMTLSVRRPNGIELFKKRIDASEAAKTMGVINWDYEIPRSAPRGNWSLTIKADGSDSYERVGFAVEDFVPQKLKVTVKADETPIKPGEIRDLTVDAQFLYGAPGTALEAEAEARIRLDHQPFKEFAEYSFGPHKKNFREEIIDLGSGMTDGAGLVTFGLDYKNEPIKSIYPLRAEIIAGVAEPGGRYIKEALQIPIRTENLYVGIANSYDSSSIPEGQPAKFKIITVDGEGQATKQNLSWKLVREDWDYHWYRENGRWRYRHDVRDLPISTGTINVGATGPAVWSHNVGYGRHRLELREGDKLLSSRQFWSGWGRSVNSDAPDNLEINALSDKFMAGDLVTLNLNTPYAGEGELVIASDVIHSVQPLSLSKGNSELSFVFDKNWGDSVYALVTLYTPRDETNQPVPRRAVGVSYVELDRSAQKLNLEIKTPDVIRPRTEHVFEIKVDSAARTKSILMNFAAVDEGILQITKYKSPDAAKHFFGKKALGLSLYDDYGRILNPNLGSPAKMRSGGDSLGGEGLTVVPTRTVAMFSGFVRVKNGVAKVKLDIPDFNGELRLMATAWNETALGSTSTPVKVRDEVPAIISLPRFLAPGDSAAVTVSLDNVEGKAGEYAATMASSGVISATDALSFNLDKGEREQARMPIQASATGIEDVSVSITGPARYKVESQYPIQVRSAFYPITENKMVALEPGESVSLSAEWVDKFIPEGTDVTVSFTKLPGIDPAPIMASLRKYPYGCTEQTVSTALPLIYASDLGGLPGQTDLSRRRAVQVSIYKLSNRQSVDGAFGLWNSGDRNARPWVGIYATDFLYRAKAQGFYVPEDILSRANKAATEIARMPRYSGLRYADMRDNSKWDVSRRAEAASYALYVLALNGEGNLGQARYHYDNNQEKLETPLSWAYLGGALKLLGDDRRGNAAFDKALGKRKHQDKRNYYYSNVRDLAGIVAVASEVGYDELALEQLKDLSARLREKRYLNTQEKGYLIMAFKAIMGNADAVEIGATNAVLSKQGKLPAAYLYGSDLSNNPEFKNNGDQKIWASVSIDGPPIAAPEPVSDGFAIAKSLHTLDGERLADRPIKQGERLLVKLNYRSTESWSRSVVIADLLPAGFEIETILRPEDGNRKDGRPKGPYAWAGNISALQIAEKRDDRFVGSLSTRSRNDHVSAYIVRAVTPGTFTMPGVVIEDMYRPEDHAITAASKITITADPTL